LSAKGSGESVMSAAIVTASPAAAEVEKQARSIKDAWSTAALFQCRRLFQTRQRRRRCQQRCCCSARDGCPAAADGGGAAARKEKVGYRSPSSNFRNRSTRPTPGATQPPLQPWPAC